MDVNNGAMYHSVSLPHNLERKCRTCGTDILELTCGIPIFGNGLQLDQKILRYLQLSVQPTDELPKCICATCFIKIESIDKFAFLATRTEEAFQSWIRCLKSRFASNDPSDSKPIFLTANFATRQQIDAAGNIFVQTHQYQQSLGGDPFLEGTVKSNAFIPTATGVAPMQIPTMEIPSAISYSDLKLGLLIKDHELLKLILKALKWAENDRRATYDVLIQRLKNSTFREILSNHNLLNDSDLTQLLKSYIGQGAMNYFAGVGQEPCSINNNNDSHGAKTSPSAYRSQDEFEPMENSTNVGGMHPAAADFRIDEESVTQMEVGVDPDLFLPYDEEDSSTNKSVEAKQGKTTSTTMSKSSENVVTIKLVPSDASHISPEEMIPAILNVRSNARFQCSMCTEAFSNNKELQQHIVINHLPKTENTESTEQGKQVIKIRVRKSKLVKSVPHTEEPLAGPPIPPLMSLSIPSSTTVTVVPIPKVDGSSTAQQAAISRKPLEEPKPRVELIRKSKRQNSKPATPTLPAKRGRPRKHPLPEQPKRSKSIFCELCKKKLPAKETLREHLEKVHSTYKCDKCDRTFKTSQRLEKHKTRHTVDPVRYSCDQCDRTYLSMNALKTHRMKHGDDQPCKCSICHKTFKRTQDLKVHLLQHAGGARPYTCPFCPKSFASKGSCYAHRKRMHPTATVPSNAESTTTVPPMKTEMIRRSTSANRK